MKLRRRIVQEPIRNGLGGGWVQAIRGPALECSLPGAPYSAGCWRRRLPRSPCAPLYAYVGCYTTAQRSARGDGIHVYRIDRQTGAWTHVQRVGDLVNPSIPGDGRRSAPPLFGARR